MPQPSLWRLDAGETAAAARAGRLTAAEILEAHLGRLAEVNGAVNAVVVDRSEAARREAEALDARRARGEPLGALHGVPVTVKINVDVAGEANSNGLLALRDNRAAEDSPVVANLRRAGAVVLGLTNTPEHSLRFFTDNPLHGPTRNPWDPERTCGGSSGGAAVAVALGIGALAHGNDLAGSLRWPASCLGVATVKPTQGRVPAYNPTATVERPFATALMSVQGPIARTVADVRLALTAMAAADPRDPLHAPAPLLPAGVGGPVRVARAVVPEDMDLHPEIEALLDAAEAHLRAAGHAVVPRALPDLDGAWRLWCDLIATDIADRSREAIRATASAPFQAYVEELLALGEVRRGPAYLEALADRLRRIRAWSLFLEETPLILAPVFTRPTPVVDADMAGPGSLRAIAWGAMRITTAVNVLGLPSAAVPVGFAGGVPAAVQLIGPRFREDLCLDAAAAIEARAPNLPATLWDRIASAPHPTA